MAGRLALGLAALWLSACTVTLPPTGAGAYLSATKAADSAALPSDCKDGAPDQGCSDAGSGPVASCAGWPDGTACTDGDPRTTGETCTAGACGGGTAFCDFLVTSLDDTASGSCTPASCTLRDALLVAVNSPKPTAPVIAFAVSGTIALGASLPVIARSVTIDGLAGVATANSGPRVALDGGGKHQILIHHDGLLTVRGLELQHGAGDYGGAIESKELKATGLVVEDCLFHDNVAQHQGGAIYAAATTVLLRSRFVSNVVVQTHVTTEGGAVSSLFSAKIDQCHFENNACRSGGAVSAGTASVLEVTNSSFVGNLATFGGGIISHSDCTVVNVTLVGNGGEKCDHGGAITAGGKGHLNHVTAINNTCATESQLSLTGVDVHNSLVAGAGTAKQCGQNGGANSGNLVGDGSCGGQPIGALKLGEFADHGGPTWTHNLLPGSAAVDAGDPAFCLADGGTDQRGVIRPFGPGCDAGAFEHGPDDCPKGLVGVGGRCLDPATLLFQVGDQPSRTGNSANLLLAAPGNWLVNGGAEAGDFAGWNKQDGGSGWALAQGIFGNKGFIGSFAPGWLGQNISLLDAGLSADLIDSGKAPPVLVGLTARGDGTLGKHAKPGTEDHVTLRVAPVDGSGKVGADLLNLGADCPYGVAVGLHGRIAKLPAGTRKLLVAVGDVDAEYNAGNYAAIVDGIYLAFGDLEMRVANGQEPFGPWQPWSGFVAKHALAPGAGPKTVRLEVRDAVIGRVVATGSGEVLVL